MPAAPSQVVRGLPIHELGRHENWAGASPLPSPRPQSCLPSPQALEKYCRTEAGFSGIQDVYSSIPNHDNKQQTFFLAETLK